MEAIMLKVIIVVHADFLTQLLTKQALNKNVVTTDSN